LLGERGDWTLTIPALKMLPQQWAWGWKSLLPQAHCYLSHTQYSLTAIAAGLRVRVEALGRASREADVDTPERWAEALSRAVADPLQLSVIRVHFQSMPRESEREESGDTWQKIPCVHLCMELQSESSLSLVPDHPYRHCTAFYHATVPRSSALFSFSGTWGSRLTDTEQVIALQPPCQLPMTNQLRLSRERTTEPTASSPRLRLLCLAHVGVLDHIPPWPLSLGSGDAPVFAFSKVIKGREWHHSFHFTERQVEAGSQESSWQRRKWKKSPSLAAVVSSVHHSNNRHCLKEAAPLQKPSVC